MTDRPSIFAAALWSMGIVFSATLTLNIGQGLLTSVVPLRVRDLGGGAPAAGLLGTAYYAGFIVGAWYGAVIVRAVGHIRAFAGFLSLLAAFALALPLIPAMPAWFALRFLHGAGIAGVAMVLESWLATVSLHSWRSRVLAAYTAISYAGFAAGQFLLIVGEGASDQLFSISAILLAVSVVPMAFSARIRNPEVTTPSALSLNGLLALSPLALMGALVSGLGIGSLLTLGPLFGLRIGLSVDHVALIMTAAFAGGMLLEWPTGYLSDRFDRRNVLIAAGAAQAVLAGAIMLFADRGLWSLMVLFVLFGGVIFALYPIALSYAADHLKDGDDMVPVATGLLTVFGVGAALGPALAGLTFGLFAGRGLFAFLALVGLCLCLFGIWRRAKRAAPGRGNQTPFAAIVEMETTPAIYELTVEARPSQLELDLEVPGR